MAPTEAITAVDLEASGLKKVASGKVREIFEIDEKTLLFVATDRISAYDVILENVSLSLTSISHAGELWVTVFPYLSPAKPRV